MKLFSRFCKHINSKAYFKSEDKILLAISGGIDSMVLAHLLLRAGYAYGVAHIDHGTRAGQSSVDAAFVEGFCVEQGLDFHLKELVTKDIKGNFHDFAHKERYVFFNSLGYDKVLTAHHQDDHVETILINIVNGRSAEGILEADGNMIRPLWPFSKQDISQYAKDQNIEYAADASNDENKYLRNIIRNQVLPLLHPILPDVPQRLTSLSDKWSQSHRLLERLASDVYPLEKTPAYDIIDLSELVTEEDNNIKALLYYRLLPYGANQSISDNIANQVLASGKTYYTNSHTMVLDRSRLLIKSGIEALSSKSEILEVAVTDLPMKVLFGNYAFSISHSSKFPSKIRPHELYLPQGLIPKSITFRTWRSGDKIKPYGLGGKSKSVKKIFVENKISLLDKNYWPIVTINEDIVWVVGLRTSDAYACTKDDRDLIKMSFTYISS